MAEKVLIVDDDVQTLRLVGLMLERQGYRILAANSGAQAIHMARLEHPDVIVLDVMMPDFDGYEVSRRLRKDPDTTDIPILMFTARTQVEDKVTGYEAGADDYLTKPFEGMELVMRVRALLRRYRIAASRTVEIGAVTLDKNSYTVTDCGVRSDIPMKEFELLFKLGSSPGITIPRDQLIEDIWGYDFEGNERTLDVHINRLRERFPAERCGFRIATVRGLGYRLEVSK